MYESYFGFSKPPFENIPDPEFLFLSQGHQEVLASLVYFVKTGKGFALLCGDVGTGKTMLVNCFLANLPPSVQAVTVSNPFASSLDILKRVAQALDLNPDKVRLLDLSERVKEALLAAHLQGRQFLLVVDEAHLLNDRSLEGIRVLSNLETSQRKLLQILLVGQHELSHRLNRPEMRPLRQRLNVNRYLTPLSLQETWQYIDHRLQVVGSSVESCFDSHCRGPIFRATRGMPRSINQLCDHALLICLAEGLKKVDRRLLKKAQEAVQTDALAVPAVPVRPVVTGAGSRLKTWGVAISTLALVTLGVFGYKYFLNSNPTAVYGASPLALNSAAPLSPGSQILISEQEPLTVGEVLAPDSLAQAAARSDPGTSPPALAKTGKSQDRSQDDPAIQERSALALVSLPAQLQLPAPAAALPSPVSQATRVTVEKGQSLSDIALKHYGNCKLGLMAVLLANRGKVKDDLVYPGQVLVLPEIDQTRQVIYLADGSYYAPYGRIYSAASLKAITSWLKKMQVRFQVLHSRDKTGKTFQRLVLGGYQSAQELQEALQKTKTKGRKG